MLSTDNHVVVLAAFKGRRGEKSVGNGNYCQVFHMRGGRAVECWVTPVDPYGVDEFWASSNVKLQTSPEPCWTE